MTNHCVDHHFKDGGGERIPLSEPLVALEWGAVVVPLSSHHGEVIPVVSEDPLRPRADPIPHDNIRASLPVKYVILILKVREDFI